jgi:hypothetical protein
MLKESGQRLLTAEDVARLQAGLPIGPARRFVGVWTRTDERTFLHCCRRRPHPPPDVANEDAAVDLVLSASLENDLLELRAGVLPTSRYPAVDDLPADVREELRELGRALAFCRAQSDGAPLAVAAGPPACPATVVVLHVFDFACALLETRWLPDGGREVAIRIALGCSELAPPDSPEICEKLRSTAERLLDEATSAAGRGDPADSRAAEAGRAAVQLLEKAVLRLWSMSAADETALDEELVLSASRLLEMEGRSAAFSTGELFQVVREGVLRSIGRRGVNTSGEAVFAALRCLQSEPAEVVNICGALREARWFEDVTAPYRVRSLIYEAVAHESSLHVDAARDAYKEVLVASVAVLETARRDIDKGIATPSALPAIWAKVDQQSRGAMGGEVLDVTAAFRDGTIENQLSTNLPYAVFTLSRIGAVELAVAGESIGDVVEEMRRLAAAYLGPFFDLVERHSSRGVASATLANAVLRGLSMGGLGQGDGGGLILARTAREITAFAWERLEPGEEEADPLTALTLRFVEAEAAEATTTSPTETRHIAWNGVLREYLRAARAAGQPGCVGFHRQNWDMLARAAETAWIARLDDETIAADLLVAKHAVDMHRRAVSMTLPCGADPEVPGLSWIPSGNSNREEADDIDMREIGQRAISDLRATVAKDGVEYIEYLATPRLILRFQTSATGRLEVRAVAEDEREVGEILADYHDLQASGSDGPAALALARKLLPPSAALSPSSRYVVAGSGFLHDLNFRNLLGVLMDGDPPPVCQVLSGPSYVDLSRHAGTENRGRSLGHLVWRYWPIDQDDPVGAEAARLVALAESVASAFQAAPPLDPFVGQRREPDLLKCTAATLCVHGKFAWPMLSAELLTSPGRWIGARDIGRHRNIPLTDSVALDLRCLRTLLIMACVAGRVERGAGAESVGLLRTLFDHGLSCVVASVVPLQPKGIFVPLAENLALSLARGEVPAVAVLRALHDVKNASSWNVAPGSSADWPVVWGRGFDPWPSIVHGADGA